ncbi:hypothetical protein BZG36_04908 [Bifiguratus adelaidae]|uniref:Jacalin-type lectin domain-containing protein n=1 Tax=Bifiguratus adelaidae TaxID=1938954 RepID=A0A261XY17_9FUNG|nr:hypothetical protein BZG36_04908 [Bifiguratus adelaidae]
MTFDAPPNRNYSNDLETAIQKFRMAAYMWQAFCSEQLYRNGFGHRTFRLHETWQPDTLSFQDVQNKISRETAHVHVIRAKKHSLKDILDPKIAQQSPDRDDSKKSLFSIFLEELNDYGPPFTNQNCYVAGLIMDTHWDTSRQVVLGHAALGGGAGNIRLGIFGSHSLHSWPRWVEDIEYCFMDSTATNTRYVANDAGESGEHWKCANVGMGAMLHEVGHCLTLAHTPTGLMSRGFNNYNRTFMPVEPHNSNPLPPSAEEGSHWHRLDIIRLRYHPCFRLPSDVLPPYASSPLASEFIPLDSGLRISAPAGLTMLEIWVDGRYNRHYEFINERQTYLPTSYDVDLVNIKLTVGWRQGQRLRLEGSTVNQQTFEMDDIIGFVESRIVKLPGVHGKCIKGADIGGRGLGAREASHVILSKPAQESNSLVSDLRRLHLGHSRDTEDAVPNAYVTHVRIHCGDALDGLVFFYSDGSTSFLGKTGGGTREFSIAKGDRIKHFVVRAGLWVDGIEIVTEQSRSGWCGGTGGALYVVEPPKGYSLVGCFATAGDWMDSFGIYYQSSV